MYVCTFISIVSISLEFLLPLAENLTRKSFSTFAFRLHSIVYNWRLLAFVLRGLNELLWISHPNSNNSYTHIYALILLSFLTVYIQQEKEKREWKKKQCRKYPQKYTFSTIKEDLKGQQFKRVFWGHFFISFILIHYVYLSIYLSHNPFRSSIVCDSFSLCLLI